MKCSAHGQDRFLSQIELALVDRKMRAYGVRPAGGDGVGLFGLFRGVGRFADQIRDRVSGDIRIALHFADAPVEIKRSGRGISDGRNGLGDARHCVGHFCVVRADNELRRQTRMREAALNVRREAQAKILPCRACRDLAIGGRAFRYLTVGYLQRSQIAAFLIGRAGTTGGW